MGIRELFLCYLIFFPAGLAQANAAWPASKPLAKVAPAQTAIGDPKIAPTRSGIDPQRLRLDWTFRQGLKAEVDFAFISCSSPIVYEGRVYIGYASRIRGQASVTCLEQKTGREIWRTWIDGTDEITISPDLREGSLYGATHTGRKYFLFRLDPKTGNIIWKVGKEGFILGLSTPVLADRTICLQIMLPDQTRIYGFDKADGKEIWAFDAAFLFKGDTSAGDKTLLYAAHWNIDGKNRVYGLDADTGRPIWIRESAGSLQLSACVFHEGKIYTETEEIKDQKRTNSIQCLDGKTGTLIRDMELGNGFYTFLAPLEGDLLLASSGGVLFCLDFRSGKQIWKFTKDYYTGLASAPFVSGDRVYAEIRGSSPLPQGFIYCLDKLSGQEIWRFFTKGHERILHQFQIFGDYLVYGGELNSKGQITFLDKNSGAKVEALNMFQGLVERPVVTEDGVLAVAQGGILYAYHMGAVQGFAFSLAFILGGLFLQLIFGFIQWPLHKMLDRKGGGPTIQQRQRFGRRAAVVERTFNMANRLARSLSGGARLIIINVYWGYLIIFMFFLIPFFILYGLFVLIPLDPWLPKWWPFAVYGLDAAIIAAIVFL